MKECCKNNLKLLERHPNGTSVYVCKVCKCKHYVMKAEAGKFFTKVVR